MEFGDRLRIVRTWRHLLQTELAEASGVPNSYISRFEKGRMIPTPAEELALRAALGWDETVDAALEALAGEPAPAQA